MLWHGQKPFAEGLSSCSCLDDSSAQNGSVYFLFTKIEQSGTRVSKNFNFASDTDLFIENNIFYITGPWSSGQNSEIHLMPGD